MGKSILLICLLLTTILTFSVFLRSFIAPKKTIAGNSIQDNFILQINETFLDVAPFILNIYKSITRPEYSRIVIVLIDALRVDFVHTKSMPFLQRSLEAGDATSFTAIVQPPTVTLPRIKALTTGSIPGFVDVVLNFGTSALVEDNVITQAKLHGKKLVFYGDDTWLSLFPDHFIRTEGTTSFFVNDYTEVDNNVTQHLQNEMSDLDFNMMILHYLGLDHIGHTSGPFSPLIGPKLLEMDGVIELIHKKLSEVDSPSLVMVCGDHGMSDQGGHGGATEAEIKVPVIFLPAKPKPSHASRKTDQVREINQIDIAPTLAALLGVPVPKNNVGTVVSDVLSSFSIQQKLTLLLVNGLQVVDVLKHNVADFELDKGYQQFMRTCKLFSSWILRNMSSASKDEQGYKLLNQFEGAIKLMSEQMTASATQYDVYGLGVSVLNLWLVLFTLTTWNIEASGSWLSLTTVICVLVTTFIHLTVCTSGLMGSDLMCHTNVASVIVQFSLLGSLSLLMSSTFRIFTRFSVFISSLSEENLHVIFIVLSNRDLISLFLIGGTVLHTVSLLSSSFVEEEHQTWYFFTVTIHVIILHVLVTKIMKQKIPLLCSEQGNSCSNGVEDDVLSNKSYKNDTLSTGNCLMSDDFKEIQLLHTRNYHRSRVKEAEKKDDDIPAFTSVAMVMVVLCLCRVMRTWNQTGNKWLNVPDTGDWLIRPENKSVLSALVGISLLVVFLSNLSRLSIVQQVLFGCGLLFVYQQKAASGTLMAIMENFDWDGCLEAKLVYLCIVLYLFTTLPWRLCRETKPTCKTIGDFHTIYILLFLVLSRPHNTVLVTMMVIQEVIIEKYILPQLNFTMSSATLYFLWMGQAAFFYQGNSNSISTVDVSAGYIGLHDYQPVLVGILLAVSTYGGTLFWMLSCIKYLVQRSTNKDRDKTSTLAWNTSTDFVHTICLSRALPLAVYTVLVTVMRYHLFVWTVFSPKLLYEGMLTVVLSVISLFFLLCNFIF